MGRLPPLLTQQASPACLGGLKLVFEGWRRCCTPCKLVVLQAGASSDPHRAPASLNRRGAGLRLAGAVAQLGPGAPARPAALLQLLQARLRARRRRSCGAGNPSVIGAASAASSGPVRPGANLGLRPPPPPGVLEGDLPCAAGRRPSSIRSIALFGAAQRSRCQRSASRSRHQSPSVIGDAVVQLIAFFGGRAGSPPLTSPTRFRDHDLLEAAVEGRGLSPPCGGSLPGGGARCAQFSPRASTGLRMLRHRALDAIAAHHGCSSSMNDHAAPCRPHRFRSLSVGARCADRSSN